MPFPRTRQPFAQRSRLQQPLPLLHAAAEFICAVTPLMIRAGTDARRIALQVYLLICRRHAPRRILHFQNAAVADCRARFRELDRDRSHYAGIAMLVGVI